MRSKIHLFIYKLISWLPLGFARGFGWLIGKWLYLVPNKERRIYSTNLAMCYPDLSQEARDDLLKQSLIENSKTLMELPIVWRKNADFWVSVTRTGRGFEKLQEAMSQGKGVIMAGPHMGNWEVGVQYLAMNFPLTVLYRPQREKLVDDFVHQGRNKAGADLAPANTQGVKKLITALKQGGMLFVLTDQLPKASAKQGSVFAPFFGHQAATMVLVNSLASRTGSPVFFFYMERDTKTGGYILNCQPAPDGVDGEVQEAATAINQGLESCIRQKPEQYLWGYKRFEKRPDGSPSPYSSKR